jgi:hypothetical protein
VQSGLRQPAGAAAPGVPVAGAAGHDAAQARVESKERGPVPPGEVAALRREVGVAQARISAQKAQLAKNKKVQQDLLDQLRALSISCDAVAQMPCLKGPGPPPPPPGGDAIM